jgi:DNA-binding MarR family transcriptional regulator
MKSIFDLEHQNQHLDSKIIAGIEKLSSVFRVLIWEQAKHLGLSPIQIQILIFLKYHSEQLATVSYLAKEFSLTKPTISDAIKILELKKFIKKNNSKDDTRSYTIQLSASGKKIIDQSEHFTEPFQKIIGKTSKTDKESFWKVISELIYRLNDTGLIQVQRMCFTCKYYKNKDQGHFCSLLQTELKNTDIRMDCPEHILVA